MSENEMKMPKIKLVNIVKHFCTITRHRLLVCKHCFKIGLYWQGLTHDLSKYSPEEFWTGVRYYRGTGALMRQSVRRLVFPKPGFITRDGTSIILNTGSMFL